MGSLVPLTGTPRRSPSGSVLAVVRPRRLRRRLAGAVLQLSAVDDEQAAAQGPAPALGHDGRSQVGPAGLCIADLGLSNFWNATRGLSV